MAGAAQVSTSASALSAWDPSVSATIDLLSIVTDEDHARREMGST